MSFFPATHNFDVYAGDTYTFTITYKENSVGVDLTGTTLASSIATAAGETATTTMTVTAAADQTANPGQMNVTLPAANSDLLTGASYVYDIEVTWPDTSVQTILRGTITVTQDVTA